MLCEGLIEEFCLAANRPTKVHLGCSGCKAVRSDKQYSGSCAMASSGSWPSLCCQGACAQVLRLRQRSSSEHGSDSAVSRGCANCRPEPLSESVWQRQRKRYGVCLMLLAVCSLLFVTCCLFCCCLFVYLIDLCFCACLFVGWLVGWLAGWLCFSD